MILDDRQIAVVRFFRQIVGLELVRQGNIGDQKPVVVGFQDPGLGPGRYVPHIVPGKKRKGVKPGFVKVAVVSFPPVQRVVHVQVDPRAQLFQPTRR